MWILIIHWLDLFFKNIKFFEQKFQTQINSSATQHGIFITSVTDNVQLICIEVIPRY